MKIGLSKLKFSFVILFSTLLSISPFNPVRLTDPKDSFEVCAQDVDWEALGTGVSCKKTLLSCPDNSNIYSKVINGEINTTDRFLATLRSASSDYEYICANNKVTNITYVPPTLESRGTLGAYFLCSSEGYNLSKVPVDGGDQFLYDVTLCCPSGFSAAHKKVHGIEFSDYTPFNNNYACCPKLKNDELADYNPEATFWGIANGTLACEYSGKTGPGTTFAIRELLSKYGYFSGLSDDEKLDRILDDKQNSMIVGTPLSNFSSTNSFPREVYEDLSDFYATCSTGDTFNLGNKTIQCNEAIAYLYIPEENVFSCPNENGCGIATDSTTSRTNIYKSSEIKSNRNLECKRCFGPGEPLSVDSTTQLMNICDPTAENSVKQQPLCNASVIDTVACLGGASATSQNSASAGVYSDNYDLCCACREQGGVWTGIGCTDTTPSGLITGLIRIVYGVMGGVALIMLIYAGIMYQTGNEANVKKARESIIRTVTGLIVLTFSILILRVIGINVLDILPTGSI